MKEKFNLGDLSIIPADISPVSSRSECATNYENGQSPFFVAPMDTVLDEDNYRLFLKAGLNVCLPRGVKSDLTDRLGVNETFDSFSLSEIEDILDPHHAATLKTSHVLIDIANGHIQKLVDACKALKQKYRQLTLMVGNIANPNTIRHLSEVGVDYVRVGIGGGAVCTTTSHTGVHYPMGSLLLECRNIADEMGGSIKIIADGGIKTTADVNIALALGADYVMLGSMFNKTLEACGRGYLYGIPMPQPLERYILSLGLPLKRVYRGMSTKEVQQSWGRKLLKPSEGIKKLNRVEYTLEGVVENLKTRLRSAMSYCGKTNLEDFNDGSVTLIRKTTDTNNRVNKI